jgi:hypothetical protein
MSLSSQEKAKLAAAEIKAGLNPERILLFDTLPARKLEVLRRARKLVHPV